MLSGIHSKDYQFSLALWINSSFLEEYAHDPLIQSMVDEICWEDNIDSLLKISDFYHWDLSQTSNDDLYHMGEHLSQYADIHLRDKNLYEFLFNSGEGRLYFWGNREEVFNRISKLY